MMIAMPALAETARQSATFSLLFFKKKYFYFIFLIICFIFYFSKVLHASP